MTVKILTDDTKVLELKDENALKSDMCDLTYQTFVYDSAHSIRTTNKKKISVIEIIGILLCIQ